MSKRSGKSSGKRSGRRQLKAARYAARLTAAELASLLSHRLRARPERLAKLAAQFAQLAEVRISLRATRKEMRQLRAAPTVAPAPAAATVAPATTDLPQPADAESRSYARIIMCLHAANWPVEWTDLLHASHTPPARVAEALLLAMRRLQ
jgi:hypothetical protein